MAKFIKPETGAGKAQKGRALQSINQTNRGVSRQNAESGQGRRAAARNLPNATIIYGAGASVMLVIGLYFMFALANWFTGLLVFILGCALVGYAAYFLRYQ